MIFANSQAGLFYGVQTLVSLLDRFKHTRTKSLFPFYLEDEPRFEYRGLRLDVVRHFRSKEEVKRLIELMSMYKLNKLDLMLSNDEGWRIDIPSFPELVQVLPNIIFHCNVPHLPLAKQKNRVYFSLQNKYDLKTTLAQVKSMM